MAKETEWNECFNIGVTSIDKAHRKLFSIVRRLVELSKNEEMGKWACAEGIKYFKNYTIKHFADEERYMRAIGYKEYEMHKILHDDMRDKTLPALEKDLEESGYSQESIHHFLGICLGWLSAHITIEDRAITGKISNKWSEEQLGKDTKTLENAITYTAQEMFKLHLSIVSEHYSGDTFGKCIVHRLTYQPQHGSSDHETGISDDISDSLSNTAKQIQVFLAYEECLILRVVNTILGTQLPKIDKLVITTADELSRQLLHHTRIYLHSPVQYQLVNNHLMTLEQLQKEFFTEYPHYSLLFDTGSGYFALCIKIRQPKNR